MQVADGNRKVVIHVAPNQTTIARAVEKFLLATKRFTRREVWRAQKAKNSFLSFTVEHGYNISEQPSGGRTSSGYSFSRTGGGDPILDLKFQILNLKF